jgi:hypothetical protein
LDQILNHIFTGVPLAIKWSIYLWLSIWSCGGLYPKVLWFASFGFNIWTIVDLITLRTLNDDLLLPDEFQWGFGQVLSTMMLFGIVYNVIDVFGVKKVSSTALLERNSFETDDLNRRLLRKTYTV